MAAFANMKWFTMASSGLLKNWKWGFAGPVMQVHSVYTFLGLWGNNGLKKNEHKNLQNLNNTFCKRVNQAGQLVETDPNRCLSHSRLEKHISISQRPYVSYGKSIKLFDMWHVLCTFSQVASSCLLTVDQLSL